MAYNDGYKGHKDSIKAWVSFYTYPGTGAVNRSYNVSSITDGGSYVDVNFDTALPNDEYAAFGSSQQGSQNSGLEVGSYSTTKFRMWWSIGESSSDAPEAAAFAIGG